MAVIYQFNGQQFRSSGNPTKDMAALQKVLPDLKPDVLESKVGMAYKDFKLPAPNSPSIPEATPAPDMIESFQKNKSKGGAISSLLGLVGGASVPGEGILSSAIKTPIDVAMKSMDGESPSLGDLPGLFKKNYSQYNDRVGKMTKDAPVAAIAGGIPQNVAAYAAGTGLLSELPFIGASETTSKLGKVFELIKAATRGGAVNAGIGQAQDPGMDHIGQDFGMGFGGEVANAGLQKAAEVLAKGGRSAGARLMESILKRPKADIKNEMQYGSTLGEELYDKGIWGTAKSMANQAEEGLESGEKALQATLKVPGNQPINKTYVADELSKLKDFYSKIPGREGDVARIEDLMKNTWQGDALTASDANEAKRAIYKVRQNSYGKEVNPLQSETEMAVARGYKRGIENIAPEAAGINKELSTYGRLASSLKDVEARGTKSNLMKIMPLIAGGGVGLGSHDPMMGAIATLGLMAGSTPLGKSGTARGIKALMDLFQSGARNTRYLAPALTSVTSGK